MQKEKCKICGKEMKYDNNPSTGWYCKKCDYRKDDNGSEYLKGNIIKDSDLEYDKTISR